MKTAIITGASQGIGRGIAIKSANDFDYIAICSRNKDGALDTCRDDILANTSNNNLIVKCFSGDVSDFDFVSNMVKNVVSETNQIDVLINNAGISTVGLLTDMTIQEWNEIISINLTSLFNTCNNVVPHMVSRKSGKIINISSVWGNVGASCEVAYSATKSGINGFTKALAKELAPSNISVNAIAFGAIDTRMNSHLSNEELDMVSEEIPYGRFARVDEAADIIANILNAPAYYTGDIIKFDGAWT